MLENSVTAHIGDHTLYIFIQQSALKLRSFLISHPLDSDVQEDVRTFPMYQCLRKINPYAYYSLNTQKQMQSDLRNFGSLTFFEQNIDDIPEVPEPIHSIDLPKALAEAEHMLDTGSPEFNEKTETILSVLYASDTVPSWRCALHGDKHKVFAALIVMMHEKSLQLEVNEYNTTDLRMFGFSMSFMHFLSKAEARFVLNVMMRTEHKAIFCVSEGVMGIMSNDHH